MTHSRDIDEDHDDDDEKTTQAMIILRIVITIAYQPRNLIQAVKITLC